MVLLPEVVVSYPIGISSGTGESEPARLAFLRVWSWRRRRLLEAALVGGVKMGLRPLLSALPRPSRGEAHLSGWRK